MRKPIATVPARRNYKPEIRSVTFTALPFVRYCKNKPKKNTNWHVPPTDDYTLACQTGVEYGAHFAQFLKDNPFWVGSNVLGEIVADIDFKDESKAKGYWVGFFSQLERLIYIGAQHQDVFDAVDEVNAHSARQIKEAQRA